MRFRHCADGGASRCFDPLARSSRRLRDRNLRHGYFWRLGKPEEALVSGLDDGHRSGVSLLLLVLLLLLLLQALPLLLARQQQLRL